MFATHVPVRRAPLESSFGAGGVRKNVARSLRCATMTPCAMCKSWTGLSVCTGCRGTWYCEEARCLGKINPELSAVP